MVWSLLLLRYDAVLDVRSRSSVRRIRPSRDPIHGHRHRPGHHTRPIIRRDSDRPIFTEDCRPYPENSETALLHFHPCTARLRLANEPIHVCVDGSVLVHECGWVSASCIRDAVRIFDRFSISSGQSPGHHDRDRDGDSGRRSRPVDLDR